MASAQKEKKIVSEFFYDDYTRIWPHATLDQMQPIYFHEFNRLLQAFTEKKPYYQEFARDYRLASELRSQVSASDLKKHQQPTDARHTSPFYIAPKVDKQPYQIMPTAEGVLFKHYTQKELLLPYRTFFDYLDRYAALLAQKFAAAYQKQADEDEVRDLTIQHLQAEINNPQRTDFARNQAQIRLRVLMETGNWPERIQSLRSREWHKLFAKISDTLMFWKSHKVPGDPNARFTEARKVALEPGALVSFKQLDCAATLKTLTADALSDYTDIEELGKYTQLKSLALRHLQLKDISFVANLTNLDELILANNELTNIEALRGLPRLSHLYLAGNHIQDFSVLESLPRLRNVFIDDEQASLEELKKLKLTGTLTYLHINMGEPKVLSNGGIIPQWAIDILDRIEPHSKFPVVMPRYEGRTKLELMPGDLSSFKELGCETSLRSLVVDNIPNCQDIKELAHYTKLRTLSLRSMQIKDISFISHLKDLDELILAHNCIEDISPLQGLPLITHLYLAGNPIRDLSVLETLPKLKTVYVDESMPWQTVYLKATMTVLKFTSEPPVMVNGHSMPKWHVDVVTTVKHRRKPATLSQAAQAPRQANTQTSMQPDSQAESFGAAASCNGALQEPLAQPQVAFEDTDLPYSFDQEGCNFDAPTTWQKQAQNDPRRLHIRDRYLYSGLSNSLGHAPTVVYDITKVKNLDCSNSISLSIDHTFLDQAGDFSCLAHASKLKNLILDDRMINDFEWLRNCRNLTKVSLSKTNIADLSPVLELPKLKHLNISGCQQLKLDLATLSKLQHIPQVYADPQIREQMFNLAFTQFLGLCQDYGMAVTLREQAPLESTKEPLAALASHDSSLKDGGMWNAICGKLSRTEVMPSDFIPVYPAQNFVKLKDYLQFLSKVSAWDGLTTKLEPATAIWQLNAQTVFNHPLPYPWQSEFTAYGVQSNEYEAQRQQYFEQQNAICDELSKIYRSTLNPRLSTEAQEDATDDFIQGLMEHLELCTVSNPQDVLLTFCEDLDEPLCAQIQEPLERLISLKPPKRPQIHRLWRYHIPFLVTKSPNGDTQTRLSSFEPESQPKPQTTLQPNLQTNPETATHPSKSCDLLSQGYTIYLLGIEDGQICRLKPFAQHYAAETIAPSFIYFMLHWPELILPKTLDGKPCVWCP